MVHPTLNAEYLSKKKKVPKTLKRKSKQDEAKNPKQLKLSFPAVS
jgi:hypothetical protein